MINILGAGQLQKMIFQFYDSETMDQAVEKREVMYNPHTLSFKYTNVYDEGAPMSTGTTNQKYLKRVPRELIVDLVLDATGASPSSYASLTKHIGVSLQNTIESLQELNPSKETSGPEGVMKIVKEFMDLAYKPAGEKNHVPRYIAVVWGKIYFPCILESADVTYKLFKPNGVPIRADFKLKLKEHISDAVYKRDLNLLSPDLTKSYLVKKGDRLDALCNTMYNDPSLFHEIARVNNLKNPRKLVAGETLVFPPIEKRK